MFTFYTPDHMICTKSPTPTPPPRPTTNDAYERDLIQFLITVFACILTVKFILPLLGGTEDPPVSASQTQSQSQPPPPTVLYIHASTQTNLSCDKFPDDLEVREHDTTKTYAG